ncbi:MAG: FAD-dependent monooxygenase [Thermodesulfobacteriota bacterium]
MKRTDYQLAIIGAGPAGINLGLALADKGFKIAIFELKASFKRGSRIVLVPEEMVPAGVNKLTCRHYFVNSLTHLREVETKITYCFVETAELLDCWTKQLDIPIMFSWRAAYIVQENDQVKLRVEGPGGGRTLSCQFLAACDGPYSISNRQLAGSPSFVRTMEYQFKELSTSPGTLESFHSHRYSPGFYSWIFQLDHGCLVAGLGTNRDNPRRFLDRFLKEHPRAKQLGLNLRQVVRRGAGLLSTSQGRLVNGRIIFLGDSAAGYPWLGGMTYPGVQRSTELAASALAQALETGEPSRLKEYENCWHDSFAKTFAYEQKARAAFNKLTDDQIDQAYAQRPGESLRRVVMELAGTL